MEYQWLYLGLYPLNAYALIQLAKIIKHQKNRIEIAEQFSNHLIQAKYIDVERATAPLIKHIATLEFLLEKQEHVVEKSGVLNLLHEMRSELNHLRKANPSIDDLYKSIPMSEGQE